MPQVKESYNMRAAAHAYHAKGFNPIPLGGDKRPLGKWAQYQDGVTLDALEAMPWEKAQGVAGIGGIAGLVAVDFDKITDGEIVARFLRAAGLPFDYWWVVETPGGGAHVWVVCPEWTGTKIDSPGDGAAAVELRGARHYTALPPSLHPTGGRYCFRDAPNAGACPPFPPSLLTWEALAAGYYAVVVEEEKASSQLGPVASDGGPVEEEWARARVAGALRIVERAGPKTRNKALNTAAHTLGGLVAAGELDEAEAVAQLTAAGLAVGQKPGETQSTIKSGLSSGKLKPLPTTQKKRQRATGHTNGTGPSRTVDSQTGEIVEDAHGPQAGPGGAFGAGLAELLEGLAGVEGGRGAVQLFALGHVAALAGMGRTEVATFCTHLLGRGVPGDWVRTDLRPAINEARKAAQAGQTDGAGWATWTDYVNAAERLGYRFRLNLLNDTIELSGARMDDVGEAIILSKLHALGLRSADVARRAFTTAAAANRFHPVKEYLAGLQWDGADHIGQLAGYFTDTHTPIDYADGTQRTVIHAFLRRWLIGACGKVYDSKTHQNPMLILDGGQGSGKSYFAKWICPLPELHFEGAIRPDDKDYKGYLTTNLVWEVSELGATMRKADREALKAFVTLVDAEFRPAYGRHSIVKSALASFIGTVNFEGALLSDPTGNRRFWPVTLAGLDWNYSQDVNKHQVWAQAFALFQRGEPGQLSPEEQLAHALIVQLYESEDILAGFVLEYFKVEPGNEELFTPTTAIISQLRKPDGADVKGSERALSMQLASTLNSLGLVRQRRRLKGDNPRWGWAGIEKLPIIGG